MSFNTPEGDDNLGPDEIINMSLFTAHNDIEVLYEGRTYRVKSKVTESGKSMAVTAIGENNSGVISFIHNFETCRAENAVPTMDDVKAFLKDHQLY